MKKILEHVLSFIRRADHTSEQIDGLNAIIDELTTQLKVKTDDFIALQQSIDKNAQRLKYKEQHLSDTVERYDMLIRTKLDIQKNKKGSDKTVSDASKLKNWSIRVKQACENKCDICDATSNLTAHHLWDKSTHPSLMYQDENGICLCAKHHNGFHATFTSLSHCTPKMYLKYKTKVQSDAVFMASILK